MKRDRDVARESKIEPRNSRGVEARNRHPSRVYGAQPTLARVEIAGAVAITRPAASRILRLLLALTGVRL